MTTNLLWNNFPLLSTPLKSFSLKYISQNTVVCVSDIIQLKPKEIATTQNKLFIYSPAVVGIIYIGKNAITAINVAPNSGIAVLDVGLVKAVYLLSPLSRESKTPSTTTIELSTSIPIAIIKAPKDTLCKSIFIANMAIRVPNIESISPLPIIRPLLIPIVIKSTPTTTTTDSIKFIIN